MKQQILVKLKMRSIYKNFLYLIGFLIVLTSITGVMYLFYDKVVAVDSDIEVTGALSINYVDGKNFDLASGTTKKIEFSVSNSSEKVSYYNIGFNQLRGLGTYKIYYNKKVIIEGSLKSIDELMTDYISIDIGETKNYILEITNTGDTNLKGKINIRNQLGKVETFADVILKNSQVKENSQTKVGLEIATVDEGLIKSSDDIGVSYYYRGNVSNNYVKLGDLTFRIVRINGDGTVRLVLDGVTATISSYYTQTNTNTEYKSSNMNEFLETWLQDNLADYLKYIASSKYCSDINHDDAYNYLAYNRIMTNKIPTLNCLGTSLNSSIGLLTIDEVILAGASPIQANPNYYLYNSNIQDSWYTMSGAKGNDISLNLFMITKDGEITSDILGNLNRNIRPVINIIKNVEVTGNGTIDNPYIIKE